VLFKPFQHSEIDAGFQELERLLPRRTTSPLSEGELRVDSGASTPTSEGSIANEIISRHGLEADSSTNVNGMDISTLMNLTSKMLKRPGMQAEIVKAMMEDEDVRNILLRECGDLDGYLKAAGVVQVTSLLPPAAAAASAAEDELPGLSSQQGDDGTWVPDATQHGDLLTKMARALGSILGQAGNQLGRLGNWINKLWSSLHDQHQTEQASFIDAFGSESRSYQKRQERATVVAGAENQAHMVLKAVLVLACMVVAIVVFKRPMKSFRVFGRC